MFHKKYLHKTVVWSRVLVRFFGQIKVRLNEIWTYGEINEYWIKILKIIAFIAAILLKKSFIRIVYNNLFSNIQNKAVNLLILNNYSK